MLLYFLNTSNDNELHDAPYDVYHEVKLLFNKKKFYQR